MAKEKIDTLYYKMVDEDYFEVSALTDCDRIAFEGHMWADLLEEFIKKAKRDGATKKNLSAAFRL